MTRELVQRMGNESAPVIIGSGILASISQHIRRANGGKIPAKILIVLDEAVASTWGSLIAQSLKSESAVGVEIAQISILSTESKKSAESWAKIMDAAVRADLDRQGLIIAVGGGIVTDIAGFCAATYLRGIAWVAVPTTLLGMVDAAIGGKTGMNLPLGKNLLGENRLGENRLDENQWGKNLAGAFWPPSAVISDTQVLTSLPPRIFRAGLAECFKHSMLVDASIEPLLACALATYSSSEPVDQWKMIDLVTRSAAVKLDIVAADPREANQRMLLNLGHTFAHAIESQFSSELLHGEAVALGLVAAATASAASGRMTVTDASSIRDRIAALGFSVVLPHSATVENLEKAAGFDKKRVGGSMTLILPKTGGGADIVRQADPELLRVGLRSIGAVDAS